MNLEDDGKFVCHFDSQGEIGVLRLKGELDNLTHNTLHELLKQAVQIDGFKFLVIEMGEVSFMASFAVAAIAYYHKIINEKGGFLALSCPSRQVERTFRLAGLSEVIPMFGSVEEAVDSLKQQID